MGTALLGTGGELDATPSKKPGHRLSRRCPRSAHLPLSTHTCTIRALREGTLTTCSPRGLGPWRGLPWMEGIIGARAGEERRDYVWSCPNPGKGCPIFRNSKLPGSLDSCRTAS